MVPILVVIVSTCLCLLNVVTHTQSQALELLSRAANQSSEERPIEGSVRLTGGSSRSEGNVEIFHSGRWGSVCDDEFDGSEGDVVCRSLGFRMGSRRVTSSGFFGPGTGESGDREALL